MTRLIESGRHEFKRLQKKRGADVRWFRDELNQPQPDIEAMRYLMQQNERQRRQARQLRAQRWRDFLTRLTPTQRQKIISIARRRPELRRRLMLPPRLLDAGGEPERRRPKEPGLSQQPPSKRPPLLKGGHNRRRRLPPDRENLKPESQNR